MSADTFKKIKDKARVVFYIQPKYLSSRITITVRFPKGVMNKKWLSKVYCSRVTTPNKRPET